MTDAEAALAGVHFGSKAIAVGLILGSLVTGYDGFLKAAIVLLAVSLAAPLAWKVIR